MLIDLVNSYIINPHIVGSRGRTAHYPSEASVISRTDGNVIGRCHRATWYDWTGVVPTNPVDPRGMWTMEFGNKLESMYIEYCKQLGIWAGDHVKFYDKIHNVSGEVDMFMFDEEERIEGVEYKSAYGYGFQKNIKQYPKLENLLQVLLYFHSFPEIKFWHLVYHSRDTMENVEYGLRTTNENDNTYIVVNDIPCKIFSLEDIWTRYQQLGEYVLKNEAPPRDFKYGFTLDESTARLAAGQITKTKFAAVKAGKVLDSDWQCLYCKHLNTCYPERRTDVRQVEDDAV